MKIEIRNGGTALISGYVNVVERESRTIRRVGAKPFKESVKPGTFKKALEGGSPVKLMLNHEKVLCDTDSGLELREDNVGLYAKAVVSDKETVEAAESGRLTGWSFGFRCKKDSWSDDGEHRTLEDIALDEVSILTQTPAYIATSVEVRDGEELTEKRFSDDIAVEKPAKQQEHKPDDISVFKAETEILRLRGNVE